MKETFKNLKFTWNYVKYQKKNFIIYLITSVLSIVISVVVPILSAKEIISLTNNELQQVILASLTIFICEILRNLIYYIGDKQTQIIHRESLVRIQTDLGKSMLKLENKAIDDNSSGVFIQRLTNDTSRLSDIFNIITNNITNILTDIGIFVTIFIINKIVFLYLLMSVTILYLIEQKRISSFNKLDKEYRKESETVTGFTGEIVRGIRDIKMLNAEKSFIKTLEEKINNLNTKRYKMSETIRRFTLFRGSIRDLSDLLFIVLVLSLISLNQVTIAAAIILYNYSGRVTGIIYNVGMLLERIKDFNLSSTRIYEIIDSKTFKKEKFGKKHIDKIKGDFEFKNVKFKYNKDYILNDMSFKIKANETVAFVGKSGAGKSTIFSLLCKMYNINKGTITIDDIDIKELDRESIRGNITIISQNPYIFNLSIKENLRLVKEDLTDEEMINACKTACLDDYINTLENGYDTIVGEGGVTLSGGQKQRLAIARALIQKTEIILFDEATSALDNETQSKIQEAIRNMKGEYTILIIAHRLSTVIDCDRIYVVDEGKIIDEGTHKELLKNSTAYNELYKKDLEQ